MAMDADKRLQPAMASGTTEQKAQTPSTAEQQVPGPGTGAPQAQAAGTAEAETLGRAVQAFDAGDYRTVRRLASKLLASEDPKVAQMARDLNRRVAVDPVLVAVLVACAALWVVVTYIYVIR